MKMGVVIPLQRARLLSRKSPQLRLAYPSREPGAAMRACLFDAQREAGESRKVPLGPRRRSPNDPPDAA